MTEAADKQEWERHWHLDRKVPVALIVALAAQTVAMVWWAATLSIRVDQLEQKAVASAPQAERIIRLESKVDVIADKITEIRAAIVNPQREPPRR